MKKIKKEIIDAVEYSINNPSISLTKVSQEFNIDRHTLSKYRKIDISKYKYLYNDEWYYLDSNEEEAIRYYISNKEVTFTDIKNKFGYKNETFKYKLEIINESQQRRYRQNFNRNLFDVIETEEDAYWLGFILADGYINENRGFLNLKLGAIDKRHLVKFCNYAQCEENIIKEEIGGVGNIIYSLTLNSKNIIQNLQKYGLFQAKSEKEIPYYNINDNLKSHYIRGIIDGDGWILKNLKGFGVVGSYDVCKYILDDLDISESRIYQHKTIKKVDIRNSEELKKFVNRYYKNALIYLDRKMDLAKQLF